MVFNKKININKSTAIHSVVVCTNKMLHYTLYYIHYYDCASSERNIANNSTYALLLRYPLVLYSMNGILNCYQFIFILNVPNKTKMMIL